ncbi:MAG: SLC13/DASS family transporter [Sulfuricurvum sp.]|nr:SLC13/DASS family transporter [Sulfuricurvum sp.]
MGIHNKGLIIALIASVLMYAVSISFVAPNQAFLAGAITLLVVLWSNEALPMAVVSLLPIILFPALGILDTKATASGYSNPIVYLFLGGFMIAIAVEKTHLHRWIAYHLLGFFPHSVRGVIFALAFTSALLSSILSNTTTTLLLMSIGLFLSEEPRIKMRYLLSIAYGASIGGIITPIGTAPNLIFLGFLGEKGLESIPFVEWVIMVAPLAAVMLIIMASILSIGVGRVEVSRESEHPALDGAQQKVLFALITLMGVLFVNAPIKPYWDGLGLSEEGIMLSFGLLMFVPQFGLLDWMEDKGKIPFRIMFLFGAGFAIAKAFSKTGLADTLAHSLGAFSGLELWMLLFFVAVLITFATEITSNTALISVMLPVIYAFSMQHHLDATLFMMVATLCASYAFMLPIATPPNAIVMSSGSIHIKQMAMYGLVLNFVGIALIVLCATTYWEIFK